MASAKCVLNREYAITNCTYIVENSVLAIRFTAGNERSASREACGFRQFTIRATLLNFFWTITFKTRMHSVESQPPTLADLGGRARRTPPYGTQFFRFAYIFTEKCPRWRSMPPTGNPGSTTGPLRDRNPNNYNLILE